MCIISSSVTRIKKKKTKQKDLENFSSFIQIPVVSKQSFDWIRFDVQYRRIHLQLFRFFLENGKVYRAKSELFMDLFE